MSTAWQVAADGLLLYVRVTPKSGRDAITGLRTTDDGQSHLAIRVAAPPEDGAANDAVRRLVARDAGLARSAVTIETGDKSRHKKLKLKGDPERLVAWLETLRTDG